MQGNEIGAYQRTYVFTADPKRIVIMCYEAAIKNLKMAIEFYASRDYEAKAQVLQRALEIIHELRQALDFEKGGEVAKNLDALYGYMTHRLVHGDLKKNTQVFEEVSDMLSELLSAWKEIFYGQQKEIIISLPRTDDQQRKAAWIGGTRI